MIKTTLSKGSGQKQEASGVLTGHYVNTIIKPGWLA